MTLLSPIRRLLCSRNNAHRVAARLFETGFERVSVVRTGQAMQPFRVTPDEVVDGTVELEIRSA